MKIYFDGFFAKAAIFNPHFIFAQIFAKVSEAIYYSYYFGGDLIKNCIFALLSDHIHYEIMTGFKDGDYDRKNYDTKEIRNDLMGIIGISKPWEVAIGQVIGTLTWDNTTQFDQDGSIYSFLGEKLVKNIIPYLVSQQDESQAKKEVGLSG